MGTKAEFDTISIGATWLVSDNGIKTGGDYEAWTVGLTKSVGDYLIGAEYGFAEDDLAGLEGEAWKLGVSRNVTKHARFTLGYADNGLNLSPTNAFGVSAGKNSPEGIVIEITLSD